MAKKTKKRRRAKYVDATKFANIRPKTTKHSVSRVWMKAYDKKGAKAAALAAHKANAKRVQDASVSSWCSAWKYEMEKRP